MTDKPQTFYEDLFLLPAGESALTPAEQRALCADTPSHEPIVVCIKGSLLHQDDIEAAMLAALHADLTKGSGA